MRHDGLNRQFSAHVEASDCLHIFLSGRGVTSTSLWAKKIRPAEAGRTVNINP